MKRERVVLYGNPYTGVRRIRESDGEVSRTRLTKPEVPIIFDREISSLGRLCAFVGSKSSFVLTHTDDQSGKFCTVALDASPLVSPKYITRKGCQSICVKSDGSPILMKELLLKVWEFMSADVDYKQVELQMVFDNDTGEFRIFLRRVDPWVFE